MTLPRQRKGDLKDPPTSSVRWKSWDCGDLEDHPPHSSLFYGGKSPKAAEVLTVGFLVLVLLMSPPRTLAQDQIGRQEERHSFRMSAKTGSDSDSAAREWFYRGTRETDASEKLLCYTRALGHDPTYYPAYYNRALSYSQLGKYQLALADYDTLLDLDPNNAEVLLNRGNVQSLLGEYQLALSDYNRALTSSANTSGYDSFFYASLHINRGIAYFHLGEYQLALSEYDKAIELNRHEPNAYANRARTHRRMKDYHRAERDYQEAIKLAPNNADTHNDYAWHLIDSNRDVDKGIRHAQRALELRPDSATVMDTVGWGYFKKGLYRNAVDWLKRAVEKQPEDKNYAIHLREALTALISDGNVSSQSHSRHDPDSITVGRDP